MFRTNLMGPVRWVFLYLASIVAWSASASDVDAEADEALRAMSAYLSSLERFAVRADIDNEIIDLEGQKLQFSSSGEIVLQRPGKLQVRRRGGIGDVELTFDGQTLSLLGKRRNVYAQFEVSGTIDDAIDTLHMDLGLDTPGMDILLSDPYAVLSSELNSGEYVGTAYVDDVECHHLAFRKNQVDWQLWISTGDRPLPMKYVITTKWVTAAPQYSVRFTNWNTQPEISAKQFEFSAPSDAVELENFSINVLGELSTGGD